MRHIAVINKKPELSGKQSIPDGAINGNGDLGLILGNSENGLRIYISKCDIWQGGIGTENCGLKPLGYIDIDVPAELYENYFVEQDMDNGEIHCNFRDADRKCELFLRACKAENSVMIESVGDVKVDPVLKVFEGETSGEKGEDTEDGCKGIYRIFRREEYIYETHVYAFMKSPANGKFYTFVATNHDVENPKQTALKKASEITDKKYEELKAEHYFLWRKFWDKSSFSVDDEELEMGWYASQYHMSGCTGNEKFPPGLFANFITVENPAWHSDFHLNYNYQAPFYAACSSNHVEFTDCYHAPLEEMMENGRKFARKYSCNGIILPVGIAPKGVCTEWTSTIKYPFERLFLGQKSNAIHPADIIAFRWKATRDREYAEKHAYPYIKACLEFFEDYMRFEDGRYIVHADSVHEVPYYKPDFNPAKYKKYINDTNNALTLGMLRLCIPVAVDMAKELGVDEEKQKKWQDILDKLSPFATYYRCGRKVFRYTEKGEAWHGDNDVGLQHIYPAGCIGLSSDSQTLKIAKNTFQQKEKYGYKDGNAVCSFFPMAARLGKNPQVIIQKLRELNSRELLPNMLFSLYGGCLENCSVFANTLNEMAMQSYDGILRIFPVWDKEYNCRFRHLRADGAFLVSSEIKNGRIRYVEIESEAGETLTIQNPYKCAIVIADGERFLSTDEKITIKTNIGSTINITE
ncbi:MAG: hypothetical protein MJ168_09535 [Clostridia bacterium]|nr:hypothetical protein [Clostridia bacterium]